MNALIYVGLTVFYFKIDKNARKLKEYNKNGDGIVDIIMLVLSVCLFAFLLLLFQFLFLLFVTLLFQYYFYENNKFYLADVTNFINLKLNL